MMVPKRKELGETNNFWLPTFHTLSRHYPLDQRGGDNAVETDILFKQLCDHLGACMIILKSARTYLWWCALQLQSIVLLTSEQNFFWSSVLCINRENTLLMDYHVQIPFCVSLVFTKCIEERDLRTSALWAFGIISLSDPVTGIGHRLQLPLIFFPQLQSINVRIWDVSSIPSARVRQFPNWRGMFHRQTTGGSSGGSTRSTGSTGPPLKTCYIKNSPVGVGVI